jgi:7,8-dihydroneopterin aldolase/epimerase/oxygenase
MASVPLQKTSSLNLRDFEVWLRLGCTAQEQHFAQPVRVSIEFLFNTSPAGEVTDRLSDTIDYVALTDSISAVAQLKAYYLVEHFCREVIERLSIEIARQGWSGRLTVQATKVRVPVMNLRSGVTWVCENEISSLV